MRARSLLVSIVLAACSGKPGKREEASGSAPPTRTAKQATCDRAAKNGLAFAAALTYGVSKELGGESTAFTKCIETHPGDVERCWGSPQAAKLRAECLTWPDEVAECMADLEQLDEPRCMRAMEQWQGLVTSEPLAEGPRASWEIDLGAEAASALRIGTVTVVATHTELIAIERGKVKWRRPTDEQTVLVDMPSERCVLAVGERSLACVADGRVLWRASPPPKSSEYDDDVVFRAAAHGAGRTLVAVNAPLLYAVSPRDCRAKRPACLVPAGELPTSFIDDVAILPTGQWVATSTSTMFLGDPDGKLRATLTGRMLYDFTAEEGGRMLVADGKQLVRMELARCRGEMTFAECGTVLHELPADELEDFYEVITVDGDLVARAGGQVHRIGKRPWKTEVGAQTRPHAVRGKLYVGAWGGIDSQVELRALDLQTGRSAWRSQLPTTDNTNMMLLPGEREDVIVVGARAYGFATSP